MSQRWAAKAALGSVANVKAALGSPAVGDTQRAARPVGADARWSPARSRALDGATSGSAQRECSASSCSPGAPSSPSLRTALQQCPGAPPRLTGSHICPIRESRRLIRFRRGPGRRIPSPSLFSEGWATRPAVPAWESRRLIRSRLVEVALPLRLALDQGGGGTTLIRAGGLLSPSWWLQRSTDQRHAEARPPSRACLPAPHPSLSLHVARVWQPPVGTTRPVCDSRGPAADPHQEAGRLVYEA